MAEAVREDVIDNETADQSRGVPALSLPGLSSSRGGSTSGARGARRGGRRLRAAAGGGGESRQQPGASPYAVDQRRSLVVPTPPQTRGPQRPRTTATTSAAATGDVIRQSLNDVRDFRSHNLEQQQHRRRREREREKERERDIVAAVRRAVDLSLADNDVDVVADEPEESNEDDDHDAGAADVVVDELPITGGVARDARPTALAEASVSEPAVSAVVSPIRRAAALAVSPYHRSRPPVEDVLAMSSPSLLPEAEHFDDVDADADDTMDAAQLSPQTPAHPIVSRLGRGPGSSSLLSLSTPSSSSAATVTPEQNSAQKSLEERSPEVVAVRAPLAFDRLTPLVVETEDDGDSDEDEDADEKEKARETVAGETEKEAVQHLSRGASWARDRANSLRNLLASWRTRVVPQPHRSPAVIRPHHPRSSADTASHLHQSDMDHSKRESEWQHTMRVGELDRSMRESEMDRSTRKGEFDRSMRESYGSVRAGQQRSNGVVGACGWRHRWWVREWLVPRYYGVYQELRQSELRELAYIRQCEAERRHRTAVVLAALVLAVVMDVVLAVAAAW